MAKSTKAARSSAAAGKVTRAHAAVAKPTSYHPAALRDLEQRVLEARHQLFNAMSIIEMVRDLAEDADGNSEEPAGPLTNIWRALSVVSESLDHVNKEFDCIATEVGEVANG